MVDSASDFLQRHPSVRNVQASEVWQEIMLRYALPGQTPPLYIIRGDTVGEADDLLVDVLARGSAPQSSDLLARQLFQRLDPYLQEAVLIELRN